VSSEEKKQAARFIEIDRRQMILRPTDVEALIPEEHPARSIWELVGRLDLRRFEEDARAVEGRAGRNAWPPRLLISIWIYAYSRGISSAREISRQCAYEPGLQWLTGLLVVNHHTLSDFRVEQESALRDLFTQVLGMLSMKGLITLERVTQDGTKIRANVNKKSFSRPAKVRSYLALAREQVELMEKQSQEEEQITRREAAARARAQRERVKKLEEALAEIEELQQSKKHERHKEPQVSVSDPEARFMWTSDAGVAPSYNVQLVTDTVQGLIADVQVVNDPQDAQQLAPAMDRVKAVAHRYPEQVIADGGYTNHTSIVEMAERGIDYYGAWTGRNTAESAAVSYRGYHWSEFDYDERAGEYICPEGKRLRYRTTLQLGPGRERYVFAAAREDCRSCAKRNQCCPGIDLSKHGRTVSIELVHPAVDKFDAKMQTASARAIYKQRAPVAEFPNAWIKTKLAFRRFRCRGLHKVRAEAIWAALTYNLQRMFKLQTAVIA
jgi:transposase